MKTEQELIAFLVAVLSQLQIALGRAPTVVLTARFGKPGAQKRIEAMLRDHGFDVPTEMRKSVDLVIVGMIGADQGFIEGVKTRSMKKAEKWNITRLFVPAEYFVSVAA